MVFELVRDVHFCLAWHAGLGGAHGDFHGWGSGSGDFPGIGNSGGADGGVGDARDVLVDGRRGSAGSGAELSCGGEVGAGAGASFISADEFADEVSRREGSRETGTQGKAKSSHRRGAECAEVKQRKTTAEEDENGLDLWVMGS
jgi:hypothetical protein